MHQTHNGINIEHAHRRLTDNALLHRFLSLAFNWQVFSKHPKRVPHPAILLSGKQQLFPQKKKKNKHTPFPSRPPHSVRETTSRSPPTPQFDQAETRHLDYPISWFSTVQDQLDRIAHAAGHLPGKSNFMAEAVGRGAQPPLPRPRRIAPFPLSLGVIATATTGAAAAFTGGAGGRVIVAVLIHAPLQPRPPPSTVIFRGAGRRPTNSIALRWVVLRSGTERRYNVESASYDPAQRTLAATAAVFRYIASLASSFRLSCLPPRNGLILSHPLLRLAE